MYKYMKEGFQFWDYLAYTKNRKITLINSNNAKYTEQHFKKLDLMRKVGHLFTW